MFKPPFQIPTTSGTQAWPTTTQTPTPVRFELKADTTLTDGEMKLAFDNATSFVRDNSGLLKQTYLGQRQQMDLSGLNVFNVARPIATGMDMIIQRNNNLDNIVIRANPRGFLPDPRAGIDVMWVLDRNAPMTNLAYYFDDPWIGSDYVPYKNWFEAVQVELLRVGYPSVRQGTSTFLGFPPYQYDRLTTNAEGETVITTLSYERDVHYVMELPLSLAPTKLDPSDKPFSLPTDGAFYVYDSYNLTLDGLIEVLDDPAVGWASRTRCLMVNSTRVLNTNLAKLELLKAKLLNTNTFVIWSWYSDTVVPAGLPGESVHIGDLSPYIKDNFARLILDALVRQAQLRLTLSAP